MKIINVSICLVVMGTLLGRVVTADRYFASPLGVWVEEAGKPGMPPTQWAKVSKAGDSVLIDGVVGDVPDIPDTDGTLAQRTYTRAKAVDEPAVAQGISTSYQQAAERLNSGKTWDEVMRETAGFNQLVIELTSNKKEQWNAVLAATNADIDGQPKVAATLLQVSAGFAKAGEGAAIGIDWRCLFRAAAGCIDFGSSAAYQVDPQPSVLQPTPDMRPGRQPDETFRKVK